MPEDRFRRRLAAFKGEGELTAFNLAAVAEALDIIEELSDQNVGGETVARRLGEYKSWDPEIFKVDKDIENQYSKRLRKLGRHIILLSEEVGREEINADAAGDTVIVVCDPFDGSFMFKRGIPDFWYTSLAFYDAQGRCLSCAVGDGIHRNIAFANEKGAFIAELGAMGLEHRFQLNAEYRQLMGRKEVTELENASIESYAMKPRKYLLPLMDEYRELVKPFKFFLPNGGPYGFVDVAEGKIDCYFGRQQPLVDVFSGIFMAQQAGATVTDFDGKEVRFTDEVETVHDVVASTNPTLHEEVLKKIADCKRRMA